MSPAFGDSDHDRTSMDGLVEIAPLPAVPAHDLFTYQVPPALRARIRTGMRVRIPLGRQTRVGVVVNDRVDAAPSGLRQVLDIVDHELPFVPDDLLGLCRWTARYYLVSLAEVIGTVVPARVPEIRRESVIRLTRRLDAEDEATLERRAPARARAYRLLLESGDQTLSASDARAAGIAPAVLRAMVSSGLATSEARAVARPAAPAPALDRRPLLTAAQRDAAAAIVGAVHDDGHATFLLHGITGSGKTEVFLAAAEATLAADRDVLVLVPEIALTHQAVERVRARFGDLVAVLHSGLGPGERWNEWRRIRSRGARVVVGARSAVFAPLARLGLVVVDEEHDAAYKQEEGMRYHARDLAVVRARLAGAVAVLASATPSAESHHAALTGRHRLLELRERPTAHALPQVELIDLRGRPPVDDRSRLMSEELEVGLAANLRAGGQSLVFLNRRGFSTYLQCPACGVAASCPQCSVTLTWHRASALLACHHCEHRRPVPAACEQCGAAGLETFGVGTEQIEDALRVCFPDATVDRMDRDAADRPNAQRRILDAWRAGTTDILVGTQMVSKGHDVPGVTLVAVLLADLSLNVPDFRAAERTFQLLVQVAGRAGRGDDPGRVLVQTLRPEHPSLVSAASHDYAGFMAGELERRRVLGYPPFSRLVNLRLDGREGPRVEAAAVDLARKLRALAPEVGLGPDAVLGPAPPPVERVRGRHRWQVLLRAGDVPALRRLARAAATLRAALRRQRVRLVVDVDPYSM